MRGSGLRDYCRGYCAILHSCHNCSLLTIPYYITFHSPTLTHPNKKYTGREKNPSGTQIAKKKHTYIHTYIHTCMYAYTLRIYQVWIIASLCWHVRVDSAIILYVNWSTFTCRLHLRCVKCSTRYRWWWTLFKPNLWLRAVVCEFLRCLWLLFHGGFRRWATFCHRSYSHEVTSWPRLLIKTFRGKLS